MTVAVSSTTTPGYRERIRLIVRGVVQDSGSARTLHELATTVTVKMTINEPHGENSGSPARRTTPQNLLNLLSLCEPQQLRSEKGK
jgi:hypothetical protein